MKKVFVKRFMELKTYQYNILAWIVPLICGFFVLLVEWVFFYGYRYITGHDFIFNTNFGIMGLIDDIIGAIPGILGLILLLLVVISVMRLTFLGCGKTLNLWIRLIITVIHSPVILIIDFYIWFYIAMVICKCCC